MQRSSEVIAAVRRFYDCFGDSDRKGCFDKVVSENPDSMIFGTAPHEFFPDRERWRDYAFQPGVLLIAGNPQGFSEGSIGWVLDTPHFSLPNDKTVDVRLTAVFRQEAGTWKMVQLHISLPVRNEENDLPAYNAADDQPLEVGAIEEER